MLHPSYSDLMKVVNSEVEQILHSDGYLQEGEADHQRR